jgi:hypothetical protein
MPTREAFTAHVARARHTARQMTNLTIILAVLFGAAQLALMMMFREQVAKGRALAFSAALIGAWVVVVGFLVFRLQRETVKAAPRCPACHRALVDGADAKAVESGRCPHCQAEVFAAR